MDDAGEFTHARARPSWRHRGQLAAALAVGAALVGSVLRFNAMQLMGAVGVGIATGAGTGIVTGLVGTASA